MRLLFGLLLGVATLAGDATGAPPRAEPAPDDCYISANLVRTAQINTKTALIGVVKENERLLDETLEEAPALAGSDSSNCDRGSNLTPYEAGGVIYTFPPNTEPHCRSLMTKTIDSALKVMTSYPSHQAFDPSKAPYDDINVQQMSYLLYAGSTKIGCAMTKDCQQGQNVLFCKLNPTIAKGSWPFGPDYFEALYERYASGIDLSTLTEDDISRAAAAVGEPSLLLLGAAAAAAATVALAV